MKHLLFLFFAINSFAAFNQSTVTIYKKRPAEFELINYSKISRSAVSNALVENYKINEKIEGIIAKYGTLKVQTFNPYKADLTTNRDSTLVIEYTIIKENFTQTTKERTTLLKQASGDNSVFYCEANGEITLNVRLIDAKTNQLIVEKRYTSTSTKKGAETDNQRDAPKVDLAILSNQCTNEIGFAFLKFVSNWNEQVTIEFEEDNKFVELPVVIKNMNTNNWSASIELLKKYTEDPNFKSKQKAKALYNYGLVLMYDDQFDKANEAFKAAITLFPKEEKYTNALTQLNEEKKLAEILIDRKNKREHELKKFKTDQDLIIKKEDFIFSNIDELVSLTGVKELKTLLFPDDPKNPDNEPIVFDFAEGSFEYNIINEKKVINGNIEIQFGTPGFSNNVRGNLKNGDGYLTIDFYNNEIDYSFGILKLNFSQNICKSLRLEKRNISNDSLYYFETDNIKSFNLEQKLYETSGLLKVNKTIFGPKEFPLVRYLGYFDGEREGSDYEQKEFKFILVKRVNNKTEEFGDVIDIKANDVPSSLVATLKSLSSVNSFYKLTCDLALFKSEIYDYQDTLVMLKKLEQIMIFDVENYVNKHNEKISSAELSNLNALVKKWVNAIAEGNYDVYKSLTPKAAWMNLQDFGKANTEFSRNREAMIFQNSSRYIITTVDVLSPNNAQYEELKRTGCSINYVAVLYGSFKHFSEKEGISLIKENGVWKAVAVGKYGNTNNMKALFVLSKENITACGCVQDVLEGNQFEADKCAYYIRNTSLMYERAKFEKCFATANYCAYIAQSKILGVSFYSDFKLGNCP
ncbi:MAG: hypothetical protein RL679_1117 [Bacteroidota bacterium]|jgi:hypothetical protein